MRFFKPLKEKQVLQHVDEQTHDQMKELQMMHYGYLSSRVYPTKKRRGLKRIAFAEFSMTLETKGQPLQFVIYRAFGSVAREISKYNLGDKLYIRCVGVNDPDYKWYLALEIEPPERLGQFPLQYKQLMAPDKLNKLR